MMKRYRARVGAAPLITGAPLTLTGAFISQFYRLHLEWSKRYYDNIVQDSHIYLFMDLLLLMLMVWQLDWTNVQ